MKKRISTILFLLFLQIGFINAQKTEQITSIVDHKVLHKNAMHEIQINEQDLIASFKKRSEYLVLPFLNGQHKFKVQEYSIHDGGGNPFPEIKTYKISSISDKTLSGRVTTGPGGINISYLTNGRLVRIYPDNYETNKSRIYTQEIGIGERTPHGEKYCEVHDAPITTSVMDPEEKKEIEEILKRNGNTKRVYRAAIVCTGEYGELNGGGSRQLIISNLADISAIFEKDMAVELVMAAGSPRVNTDKDTDPFIPANGDRTGQAQRAVEASFSVSRYDIGHAFHRSVSGDGWDSGGLARLGAVCRDNSKASGWSGSFNNTSNGWIQLATHEFGHMFNAPHTFNGDGSNCTSNNHPDGTAYEIGSGTTIMSYQGICDPEYNIPAQGVADNYFHINSLNRMVDYLEAQGDCNENAWIVDNNSEPIGMANPCSAVHTMPRLTPFTLIGEATDADGDALTYNWEQYDEDGPQSPTHGFIGNDAANSSTAPLYRSYPPNGDPTRTIPTLANLSANVTSDFEVLTRKSRNINFRFVVRDNNPAGGAIDWDQITIRTMGVGPLLVTSQAAPDEVVQAGSQITVTWDPNNSEDLCDRAAIKLSIDGGLSFPFVIAKDIDYALGTADVIIPASFSNSDKARIMVACDDYECFTFFNINNRNFTIESNCFAPSSILCDDSDGTYLFGDPLLNFDEDVIDGTTFSSLSGPLEAQSTMSLAVNDQFDDCTIIDNVDNPFQEFKISVTQSGSYVFRVDIDTPGTIRAYSIFEKASFSSINPCPSFIASNARWVGQSFSISPEFTANLEACTEYVLVAMVSSDMTTELSVTSIDGPGFAVLGELTDDYALTFMAFDAETEVIVAINDEADFRTLPAGEYFIRSAFYKVSGPTPPSNVDPTTLIGLTQLELLGGINCIFPSGNEKEITIEATCFVENITEVSRTACNPLTNTYSITINFGIDMGPGGGQVTINGQTFDLSGADATITLTDLIANGEMVDLDFKFTEDQGCDRIYPDVFQASMNCCPISIDLGQDRILCAGDIEMLDGGGDGVMYEWLRDGTPLAETTQMIEVTNTGLYTVLVTNSTGCINEAAVLLTFESIPSVSLSTSEVDACFGETFNVNLFTNANDIEWFRNDILVASNQVILGVSEPGDYSVKVTNEFGCVDTASFIAIFKDAPEVYLGEDLLTCDGSIIELDAELSGSQYTYDWRRNFQPTGGNTQILDVITFGVYTVTVTDTDNGCESVDTIEIDYEELPEFDLGRDKTNCDGNFYTLEAEDSPFTIEWFLDDVLIPGVNTVEYETLVAGTYVAKIEQNDQCIEADTVVVEYLEAPNVDFPEVISACPGETVELIIDDNNATFQWSSLNQGNLSETSNTLTVTTSDTYYVLASSISTFCPIRDTVEVIYTSVPMLDLGDDKNACDGEVITLESETQGFLVEWYFNNTLIPDENGASIDVTQAGIYTIRIDQGGNCTSEDEVIVTYSVSPEVNLGDDRSACPGDVIPLDGGDAANTYVWSSDEDGILAETSSLLDVTKSGTYYVTATNAGDCSRSDTITVTFADLPQVDLGTLINNCNGNLHTFIIDSEGFDLEWFYNDDLLPNTEDELLATESGTYIVKISAGVSCSVSDTIEVTYNDFPVVDLGDDRSACPGDMIELVVNETGNEYEWSTLENGNLTEFSNTLVVTEAATYMVDVIGPSGCVTSDTVRIDFVELPMLNLGDDVNVCEGEDVILNSTSNGFDIEWLLNDGVIANESDESLNVTESGTYIMRVSSSVTCATMDTVEVTFFPAPSVNLGDDRSACPGDDIVLDAGSGSSIEYMWSSMNQGALTESSNMLSVDMTDTYFVIATNAGDCSTRDTVSITFAELPDLDLGEDIDNICEGADLQLIANANGFETTWLLNDTELTDEKEETLDVVESGTYIVIASANANCSTSDTIEINLVPAPPVAALDDEVACEGSTINLLAGIDDEFQFIWSDQSGVIQDGGMASIDVTSSGFYSVEVVDLNNCRSSEMAEVTFIDQPTIEVMETIEICNGTNTIINTTSNVTIIDWYKDDQFVLSANDEDFEVSEAGQYIAIVGAGTECEASDTIDVSTIDAPDFVIEGIAELCSDDIPSMLSVVLENGEEVQWFLDEDIIDLATDADLEIMEAGVYSAEVRNTTGCTTSVELEVNIFESAVNSLIPVPQLCEGDAFIMEATTDGSSFEWRDDSGVINGETELMFSVTASGVYSFVSFNDANCETISEFEVVFDEVPNVDLGPSVQNACIGFDIEFEVEDANGNSYTWFKDSEEIMGETGNTFSASENGVYSVTVENDFGCSVSGETEVSFFEPPTLSVPGPQNFCEGESASISITTDADIIRWILNDNTVANDIQTFDVLTGGTYTIEVESEDNCIISEDIEVNEIALPVIVIDDIELCPGESQDINVDSNFQDYFWDGITATGSSATVEFQSFTMVTTQNASLTVMDQFNCSATEEFAITYFPPINAQVAADRISSCIGESEILEANGGLFYEWTDPDGTLSATDIFNPVATPTETTVYNVMVSDNCPGNVANLSVEVVVNDLPEANAGMDTCSIVGLTIDLMATGGVSYQWDNTDFIVGASNTAIAEIEITEPTTFTVTVTDNNGCINTDQIDVCILDDPLEVLKAVTIITPNGDAFNDQLEFNGLEVYPENILTVFNRWGNIIFRKRGYQNDALRWDGTRDGEPLPADTYYYILEFSNFKIKKSITLLRD